MPYPQFSESALSADERFREKNEILKMLREEEWKFTEREHQFINRMKHATQVTAKQLFWLRDIKDKYL